MSLPRLDLSLYTNGTPEQRQQFGAQLLDSLSEHGFVKIKSHGVTAADVANIFKLTKSFFHLDVDIKSEIQNEPKPRPQRGWSRIGAENTATLYQRGILRKNVDKDFKDAREHFDIGAKNNTVHPNLWPKEYEVPGFRHTLEDTFVALEKISYELMGALELGFGLPHGTFLTKITSESNASELRLNHYPPINIERLREGKVSRIWPHFDLGVITLLFQDTVGGLEFEDRTSEGAFHRVSCEATSDIIVNISETLQRWTNDQLRAGLHRVAIPEAMASRETGNLPERYSIAYFCKADRCASVAPLKEFVSCGKSTPYPDMTAIEFHEQRLRTAY